MKNSTKVLPDGYERLERAIAHQGLASRREAKALITAGHVTVNKKKITEPGFGIRVGIDTIAIAGNANAAAPKESVLVYKPRGVETTKSPDSKAKTKDLHDQFPKLKHLSPIGRLDKESEGLIIMSNDGTLTKAITGENSSVAKTYSVTTREQVTDAALAKMQSGIMLDKIMTKPAPTKRKSRTSFIIELHEGRKHQIRRMCDACHLTIESLIRISIGHLKSAGMKAGNVKRLSDEDVKMLKE